MAYLSIQVIPVIMGLFCFDKKDFKQSTIDDWLFAPLFVFVLLIPFVGAFLLAPLWDDEDKWLKRLSMISVYIVIIGVIILVTTKLLE
mgnify:CR=1 FL=1